MHVILCARSWSLILNKTLPFVTIGFNLTACGFVTKYSNMLLSIRLSVRVSASGIGSVQKKS